METTAWLRAENSLNIEHHDEYTTPVSTCVYLLVSTCVQVPSIYAIERSLIP